MSIIKSLITAVLPAFVLGCASLPGAPVALRDDPASDEVALSDGAAEPACGLNDLNATRSAPFPIIMVGLNPPSSHSNGEPIPTSLAGTMFEPISPGEQTTFPIAESEEQNTFGVPAFSLSPGEHVDDSPDTALRDPAQPGLLTGDFCTQQTRAWWQDLIDDQRNIYRCESLAWLAGGVAGAAIVANTNIDEQFRHSVAGPAGKGSDDLKWMKSFGTGYYTIPALLGVWAVDECIIIYAPPDSTPCAVWLEEWSGRSLRGLIVGAVPLLSLQFITGGSRPGETSAKSHWKPFRDDNGASGHAFVGAIPFWTAAQLTDCMPLQYSLYGMGTIAGIARIHTDSHYLSQVLLGCWLAGLSVAAVDSTEWQKRQWLVTPMAFENGAGAAVMHTW